MEGKACEKGVQVNTCRKLKRNKCTQTVPPNPTEERSTQCGSSRGSYSRDTKTKTWRYDDVIAATRDKDTLIQWLMEERLIARNRSCPICNESMNLRQCDDRSDGWKWECRRQKANKRHKSEVSIRSGSWFDQSKMTLDEIMKFTYWWCQDLDQKQIKHELRLSESTVVEWHNVCREVCEVCLLERSERLGGPGKVVQIGESKFGKRKYHRGHHVEGQWVLGGIEEESRKCFLIPVEKRDELSLLPIIQRWIEPGTIIVSDGWGACVNLADYGYEHKSVNHSKEFVNENGDHTNKIESHWRQAKSGVPKFGIRKHLFSTYLAEFIWRYKNKSEDLFAVFLNEIKSIYKPDAE